ncbi:MAG: hypothetical protein JST16_02550 [Bdellovibrionales bacterium]|nr:hypothetical protein [Bdellovibrionales bacterium]
MNRSAFLGFLALACSVGVARADYIAPEAGFYHYDYKETLAEPDKSTELGWLKLIGARAQQNLGTFRLTERLAYSFGSLQYGGTTLVGHQPVTRTNNHHFYFAEGNVELPLGPSLSLYAGLEYRRWFRDLSSYTETYSLYYAPIGVKFVVQESTMSFGLDASVRPMFHGSLLATTSNFAAGYDDLTLPVTSAIGWRVALPIVMPVGSLGALMLTPFYQYLKIGAGAGVNQTANGQTVPDTAYQEPASTSKEYGVTLGFAVAL